LKERNIGGTLHPKHFAEILDTMNMKQLLGLVAGLSLVVSGQAASPSFQEVYSILRTNLVGINEADLEKASIEGLLGRLGNKALLLTNAVSKVETNAPQPTVARTAVFDTNYGYLRLGTFGEGAGKEVASVLNQLLSTNKLRGMVLDLRFAQGTNNQSAAEVADLFFPASKLVAKINGAEKRSTGNPVLDQTPVAILINRRTVDAAEVLAASLRAGRVGLLLGSPTAGSLSMYKDIPLSNGQILRVAKGEILFEDGSVMPFNGVVPDIKVEASLLDEQMYLLDAYKQLTVDGATNKAPASPQSRLINEAELVRRHKEGLNPDIDIVAVRPDAANSKTLVRDPALARALDLLKGLAMVREYRNKR
jgi:hypothetical protein